MTIENARYGPGAALKEKEISLGMIFDAEGNILWPRKKKVTGTALPVNGCFFLYIDSAMKESFNEIDGAAFERMGKLLGDRIENNTKKGNDTDSTDEIIGSSDEIQRVREAVIKYSVEDEPVLLCGETGVGKNHIARLIHRHSGKKGKFVIVDTPNINDGLFESKLFGHKKGAFTDAKFDKIGWVEEAAKGTLFFDEIAEVPLEIQAKLLRFIDTQKYHTLGESTEKEADVRIIAATNKDLLQGVENREFRSDLYYRLNVLEIEIPPLRERKEDIKQLVLENRQLLRGKEIGKGFWDAVYNYHWPGNVRQLLNILKRAGIMLESPISGEKFSSIIHIKPRKSAPGRDHHDPLKLKRILERLEAGETFWQSIWKSFIARDIDRNMVKAVLKRFYTESFCCFKKMIKRLNIEEKDYQRFMSALYKYRIDPRE